MKKRSILTFICTVLCLALIFCSCGKAPNENSEESGNQSISDNEAPAKKSHLSEVPDGYIGIYTPDDLQNVQKNMTANYIIMNDIDLKGYKFEQLFAPYQGTFDGNNYSIKNYSSDQAMFRYLSGGSILNLTYDNALIDCPEDSDESVGGIVEQNLYWKNEPCTIKNCHFNGKITARNSVGGIMGWLGGEGKFTIENCSFNGDIELIDGVGVAGGIIGSMEGDSSSIITGCSSAGTIKSNDYTTSVGGISGEQYSEITNCYSLMNIQLNKSEAIGGIAGRLKADASCLYFNGSYSYNSLIGYNHRYEAIEVSDTAGAIAGQFYYKNTLQYCYYPDSGYPAVGDGTPYANVEALPKKAFSDKKSFKGFDFENIWKMKRGDGPVLKNAQ